jgi:purine nucleosidase
MSESARKILLDVDTGIDDALAITYLLAKPEVDVVAAGSVHGNIDAHRAALNTLRVMELCGYDHIPVAQGAAEPLAQPLSTAWMVHASDELGNLDLPLPAGIPTTERAADQILRLSLESPGEIDLLAVGPLTNVALAISQDSRVLTRFRSVVIMGGSGPASSAAKSSTASLAMDANIDHDPEAADIVFSAAGEITMVGTNLEAFLELSERGLNQLEAATHAHSRFAWQVSQFYLDFQEQSGGRRVAKLWDPLAAAILLDDSLVESSFDGKVDVVPSERGFRAMWLPDRRDQGRFDQRPVVRIVTAADAERFVADFLEMLTTPLPKPMPQSPA